MRYDDDDDDDDLGISPIHSGLLSLAIPPWVGTISTGDGLGHR